MVKSNADILATYRKEHNILDSVEMYSGQAWRRMGYQVKKGSVCKHRVEMYKDIGCLRPNAHTYKKWFSLFTRDQVEPIK